MLLYGISEQGCAGNFCTAVCGSLMIFPFTYKSFSPFKFSVSTAVTYDKNIRAIRVKVPDSDEEFLLHPATVRRNDRSAQSVVSITSCKQLSLV